MWLYSLWVQSNQDPPITEPDASPCVTSTLALCRMPGWWQTGQRNTPRSKPGRTRHCGGLGFASQVRTTSRHPPVHICPNQRVGEGSRSRTRARTRQSLPGRAVFGSASGPEVCRLRTSSPLRWEQPCRERRCLRRGQQRSNLSSQHETSEKSTMLWTPQKNN